MKSHHCKSFFNKKQAWMAGGFTWCIGPIPCLAHHFLLWFKALQVIEHHVDSKKLRSYYLWDNWIFSELLQAQRNWSCRPAGSHVWGTWSLALLAVISVYILLLSRGECGLWDSQTPTCNATTWHLSLHFIFSENIPCQVILQALALTCSKTGLWSLLG